MSIKDIERRKRKEAAQGGTDAQLRNEAAKKLIREQFREIVMDRMNTGNHMSYAEACYRSDNFKHGGKKVSRVVISQLIEEMMAEGLVTKYLKGTQFYIKPTERNLLDQLYAPIYPISKAATVDEFHMEDFGHRNGGLGNSVNRGYSSYYRNDAAWPEGAGW